MRLETQKQTLIARDESIKKLLEMLQNKGMGECSIDKRYFFPSFSILARRKA
jgi:golgin subfamily B member 1